MCTAITTRYAQAKTTPFSVKAVGMLSEIAKNAAIPASRGRRSAVRSGGTAFVSQAKPAYIHQIALSIRTI